MGAVRANSGGVSLPPAAVPSVSPSASPDDPVPETGEQWTAVKARGPISALRAPHVGAAVKVRLPARTRYGVQTVMLVDRAREVDGRLWYRVWLPAPPNMSRGWVPASQVSPYAVASKIVIHLGERRLLVVRDDIIVAAFPVGIGRPDLPTPSGSYFVTERLRPVPRGGAYGVLALSISAFQPKLAYWEGRGQVAIHGTNQPQTVGQAVSHGCVRMLNKDILALSRLISVGSPVIIRK